MTDNGATSRWPIGMTTNVNVQEVTDEGRERETRKGEGGARKKRQVWER